MAGTRTALEGGGRPRARGDDFVSSSALLALVIDLFRQGPGGRAQNIQTVKSNEDTFIEIERHSVKVCNEALEVCERNGRPLDEVKVFAPFVEVLQDILQHRE